MTERAWKRRKEKGETQNEEAGGAGAEWSY